MEVPVPSAGQERVPNGAVSPLPTASSPSHSSSQTPHLHSSSRKPLPALSPAAPFPGEKEPELPIPVSSVCPSGVPQPPAPGSSAAVEPAVSQDPVTARSVWAQPRSPLCARLHLPALVLHLGWQRRVSSVCPFPPLWPLQPPAQRGLLAHRSPQSFGNNTEAEGPPGQGKTLQDTWPNPGFHREMLSC